MSIQTESARLWEPSLPGIELFQARFFRHRFNKHFHETYTIGLNETGVGCCRHQGELHFHYPGSFKLLNPGDVHAGQVASSDGWTFRNLYIEPSLIKQCWMQLESPVERMPCFQEPIIWEPSLRPLFYELFNALTVANAQLAQQSLLIELLSGLFSRSRKRSWDLRSPAPESKAIALIRNYLDAHYADNVSIDSLAKLANLSPYYLIRCFRQVVGCAPHQYQQHQRLMRVKQTLRTSQPLSIIAVEHGFYDQSHLNRVFKQTFGVTPGQYQKDNSVQYPNS